MPRLVVIMPAYNAEKTVERAINSTLRALPPDALLVVRDDGSSDGTAARLERLCVRDPRLQWTTAEVNRGVAASIQWLMATTDSEWIGRMDSDDVCLPWRFALTERHRRSLKLDACFTGLVHADAHLRRIRPAPPLPLSPEALPYDLLLDNSLPHGGVVVRREAVERAGGYRDVPSEDYDLWLRMVLDGRRMGRTAVPGFLYRSHPGQVTERSGWQRRAQRSCPTAKAHDELLQQLTGDSKSVFHSLRTPAPSSEDCSLVSEALARLWEAASSDPALNRLDRTLLWRRLKLVERRRGKVGGRT